MDAQARKWFVYVTDIEMAKYFRNESNGLKSFFDLKKGEVLKIDSAFISSKSETFQKAISGPIDATINCLFSEALIEHNEVRVFEVLQ